MKSGVVFCYFARAACVFDAQLQLLLDSFEGLTTGWDAGHCRLLETISFVNGVTVFGKFWSFSSLTYFFLLLVSHIKYLAFMVFFCVLFFRCR